MAAEDVRTTVVLKNLPTTCTGWHLAQVLNAGGFCDCYDFVYVPVDLKKQVAHGFAFVNMLSHEIALRAMMSMGAMQVQWSDPHQGLEALVVKYRNSPIMHRSVPEVVKPMLFCNGVQQRFLRPTVVTQAPRVGKASKRNERKSANHIH